MIHLSSLVSMSPSSARVAVRYLFAGLIQPPPAMVEAIVDWAEGVQWGDDKMVTQEFPVDTRGWGLADRLQEKFRAKARRALRELESGGPADSHAREVLVNRYKQMAMTGIPVDDLDLPDHITVRFYKGVIPGSPRAGGSWVPYVLSITDTYGDIRVVVEHELRHFAQSYLSEMAGTSAYLPLSMGPGFGVPSGKIRTPDLDGGTRVVFKKLRDVGIEPRGIDVHGLLDVEFYTDLADTVGKFKRYVAEVKLDPKYLNTAIAQYASVIPYTKAVSVYGKAIAKRFLFNNFLASLKRVAPGKYKKAMKEFYKAVHVG